MLDQQVLNAVIKSRAAYDKISRHVTSKDFTPPVKFWFDIVTEYYKRDSQARSVDRDVLRQTGAARCTSAKQKSSIMDIVAGDGDDTSCPNVSFAYLELKRLNSAAEFASATLSGDHAKARTLLSIVNDLADRETLGQEDEKSYAVPVEELFDKVGTGQRTPLSPRSINSRIGGGVLPGHHILVFGRTEVGKSTFVINMAAGFLHAKKRVLYVGNEDEINNLKARMLCRITGRTIGECEGDKASSASLFRHRGGESLLRMVHLNPGSIESIGEEVKAFPCDVLIVDQIRNLSGDEDGQTRKMEANAIKFRSLINAHSLVGVSVTQAGNRDDRHNQDSPVWLSSGDVDSSRVGLPAQVDLMLGIGGNNEMIARGQRAISLCKNKLFSGENAREGLIVNFDLQRSIVS